MSEGTDITRRYEKTTAFEWTERAFELVQTGQLQAEIREPSPGVEASHVWGPCPRCGHHVDDWQSLSTVTGMIGSRSPESGASDATAIESVDVSCGCGTAHPDAPAGITGCGVSFRIEFEPLPDRVSPGRES